MSELAVEREIEMGLLAALDLKETTIERNIQYAYLKNKYLTPAAKAFWSCYKRPRKISKNSSKISEN